MKVEQLIAKGVQRHFDGKKVVFNLESLKEHYDGLQIHETDVIYIGEEDDKVAYVKASDINGDSATEKEVAKEAEGMTYAEAENLLKLGKLIALPEWVGFWFANIKTGEVLVLTKEGDITNTPFDEFKERKDWIEAEATPEQQELLESYFNKPETEVIQDPVADTESSDKTIEDTPEPVIAEELPKVAEAMGEEEVIAPVKKTRNKTAK